MKRKECNLSVKGRIHEMKTTHFNIKILCGFWCKEGGWIRIGQSWYGLALTCSSPLFSGRNGYKKSLKLLNGWRLKFVPKCW